MLEIHHNLCYFCTYLLYHHYCIFQIYSARSRYSQYLLYILYINISYSNHMPYHHRSTHQIHSKFPLLLTSLSMHGQGNRSHCHPCMWYHHISSQSKCLGCTIVNHWGMCCLNRKRSLCSLKFVCILLKYIFLRQSNHFRLSIDLPSTPIYLYYT